MYSHIPLVLLAFGLSERASAAPPQSTYPLLATAVVCVIAVNAVFHIVATWKFREYSPGVVTGTLLFLPVTGFVLRRTIANALLTSTQLVIAAVLGVVVGLAIVLSLWLPMDFDWRLRRPSALPSKG